MRSIRNLTIDGKHAKPITIDVAFKDDGKAKPVVIFAHGFKGFKDFAYFNLVAEHFAEAGFFFVKFNFSHNGTSPLNPDEFVDLDAFSQNNFSIELEDLGSVIDWLALPKLKHSFERMSGVEKSNLDLDHISLIGHSRGGGIVLLKAAEDDRVSKVVTWASVNEYGRFWVPEVIEQWKKDRIIYIPNMRTKQEMPLDYQIYDDYEANVERLHIPNAVKKLKQPVLIIHGTKDPTVNYRAARELDEWCPNSELMLIEGGDHVFGGRHPWKESDLPKDAEQVVQRSIEFLAN